MKRTITSAGATAWSTALIGVLLLGGTTLVLTSQGGAFPSRLDRYFKDVVKLTADEQKQLLAGQPVTKLLDADESKEVAVLGAVWINAPMQRYVAALKDIENFEKGGGFKVTKRISSPPQLADFAKLQLPAADLADLRGCRVDACEIKLGEPALKRFRSEIKWDAADANAAANRLMQQLALEYVTRYLEGGNETLAVYRDNDRPTFVSREFRAMVDSMPELTALDAGAAEIPARVSEGRSPRIQQPAVLAGNRVWFEADDPRQSPHHPRDSAGHSRRLEDVVRITLFLDRPRIPGAHAGRVARARVLVRDRQSQSRRWSQWLEWVDAARPGEKRSAGRYRPGHSE